MNDQAIADNILLPTSVRTIMETWTLKMGYPLINVTRQYQTEGATITQVTKFIQSKLHKNLWLLVLNEIMTGHFYVEGSIFTGSTRKHLGSHSVQVVGASNVQEPNQSVDEHHLDVR
jgi:hypothetical protein